MQPFKILSFICVFLPAASSFGRTFHVATYNVENYLIQATESRPATKSGAAKAKVCETIRLANPDVVAIEEMGTTNALLDLKDALLSGGADYPYWEHVQGFDTNIHVAVLSKFPITVRRPHTNENFLLDGRRFQVSRGFADLDIQVSPDFHFTLLVAHLKSRRPTPDADEAQLRLEEAKCLRAIVDEKLKANPDTRIIVAGDFNDVKNSPSTRELIGRGRFKLLDTRPAERNGDDAPNENPRYEPRNVCWTHYYGAEDSFSRIDYILLSPAMARHWVKSETRIPTIPNWGTGSDHRLVLAGFDTESVTH